MQNHIYYFLLLSLSMVTNGLAQQITCSPQDKEAFEDKIIEIDGLLEKD